MLAVEERAVLGGLDGLAVPLPVPGFHVGRVGEHDTLAQVPVMGVAQQPLPGDFGGDASHAPCIVEFGDVVHVDYSLSGLSSRLSRSWQTSAAYSRCPRNCADTCFL